MVLHSAFFESPISKAGLQIIYIYIEPRVTQNSDIEALKKTKRKGKGVLLTDI